MAYLCPVCEDPQPDAVHLANHLAFTALLGDDDHEAWLDDHAPDWEANDEAALADRLREAVESVEHPIDDVETHDHDHGDQGGAVGAHDPKVAADAVRSGLDRGPGALDAEAQEIVAEARELTREMQQSSDGDEHDASDGGESAEDETE